MTTVRGIDFKNDLGFADALAINQSGNREGRAGSDDTG